MTEEFRRRLEEYLQEQSVQGAVAPNYTSSSLPVLSIGYFDFHRTECEAFINENEISKFPQTLMNYEREKEVEGASLYKRAQVDRKHYSKIINSKCHPSKNTVLRLLIALELDENQAEILLNSAGFSLSKSSKIDLIIRFCIRNNFFDLDEIDNEIYDLTHTSIKN